MKKKKREREEEGIQGEREKKNLMLALNRSGYFCWCPVCATGGGGWKDWFHFSPFLGHTLHCCSACRLSSHCSSPLLGVLPLS